ncbi:MAG TPA: response regulator transcription factor [Chloroflexaceae bacterium]|nr:response regulator transcription factor [Chloroflexaceae bacterium]
MMASDHRQAGRGPARLIIADDHDLARLGLRRMLADAPGLELVGEAGDGRAAVALCQRVQPDLALIDVRMPDLDGLATTRAIKERLPLTRVLIITTHEHPDYLVAALKAGAAGYLLKDITRDALLDTIRRVLRGESILSGEMVARALQRLAGERRPPAAPPPERLTPREGEVLALVVEGLTNREIAARLGISVGTAKIHVEHIIGKLGVSDRTQAAVCAIRYGLVQPTAVGL